MTADPLSAFALAVCAWFTETFGAPTPPQMLGWPPIQCGEHTLILASTGSGKTLATLPGLEPAVVRRAFELCRAHVAGWTRRVFVQTWNSEPALNGPAQPLLESLGFRREPPGLVWDG